MPKAILKTFIFLLLSTSVYAFENTSIVFGDDQELEVLKYKSKGKNLLVALPSEHGITTGLQNLASNINKNNTEVWIADPFSSFFLAPTESSLKQIPIESYVSLINEAQKTNKNIYLFSNDKNSALLLKAIHKWQLTSKKTISGVILVSPNLYSKTPTAGNDGVFTQIASSTNLPVLLFIPEKSTLSLRINDTVNALKTSGSDVIVKVLNDVRDRFFFRDDASKSEKILSSKFSNNITQGMKEISVYAKQRDAIKLTKNTKQSSKKITRLLQKYNGKLIVKDFTLIDLEDKKHTLSKYKGEVVLLNFWASWCPPCIHEMPSMSRLQKRLKDKPFKILAVNLGESPQQMSEFIKKYPVNFSILLDSNRDLAKKWKVFAFPTSYIIDKKGKIRYSVAGGLDWDTKEIKKLITKLTNE